LHVGTSGDMQRATDFVVARRNMHHRLLPDAAAPTLEEDSLW
jgi:hypothetical protein